MSPLYLPEGNDNSIKPEMKYKLSIHVSYHMVSFVSGKLPKYV